MRKNIQLLLQKGKELQREDKIFSLADKNSTQHFEGLWSGSWVMAAGKPIPIDGDSVDLHASFLRIAKAVIEGNDTEIGSFDGPFLVVVINFTKNTVTAVRDKFGLRSLYYEFSESHLNISDDLSSISVGGNLRASALNEWMHYGAPLSPHTFFNDVRVVPAGTRVTFDLTNWSSNQNCYFLPESLVSEEKYKISKRLTLSEASTQFCKIFDDEVSKSVAGASKVSLLLSGGVDSSLLAAFARNHTELDAVTVDLYGEKTETEIHFATAVAKKLKIDLRSVRFGRAEFIHHICRTVHETASPVIVENAVALNFVAKQGHLPKNQLIIDGEGADALMGGSTSLFKYSYSLLYISQVLGLNSSVTRRFFERLRVYLSKFGLQTTTTLDRFGLDVGLSARNIEVQLLTKRLLAVFSHVDSREEQEISALMMREFYDYLVPLMVRIDRMSAHSSTNTVLPYLQQPVFDFLANLNSNHRFGIRGLKRKPVTKFMLKSVLSDYIGNDLVHRPKVGFGIPAHLWINLPDLWRKDLWVAEQFSMSSAAVSSWIDECHSRDKLFILSMEIWGRIFVRNMSLEQVDAEWIKGQ